MLVIREQDDTMTWTLGGIAMSSVGAPGGVKILLVVASEPGDPLEEPYLKPLKDIALAISPVWGDGFTIGPQTGGADRFKTRASMLSHLEHMIMSDNASSVHPRRLAFLLMDLDHLSRLNERSGWDRADRVIEEMIRRVSVAVPSGSRVEYFGGGRVAVATPYGITAVTARSIIASIMRAMHAPFELEGEALNISVTLGWCVYPQDASNAKAMMSAAHAALTEARRSGAGHDCRATEAVVSRHNEMTGLERSLMLALQENELSHQWMPIINVESQEIVAVEALLRWERPDHGPVSPGIFIQYAEEAGLIEQVDTWSLRHACLAAAGWSSPLRVCVNISPLWLANGRLAPLISATLAESGLAAHRLQIELSELRSFGPTDLAHQELSRLRALGVKIALDDFGSGYSCLERLSSFPLDQIKLDRFFMGKMQDDPRVGEVLRSLLRLATVLGISCCAKGVETERQMAFLEAYGCTEVQGYLLGQPVDHALPGLSRQTDV